MLEGYEDHSSNRLKINWLGWIFMGRLDENGDANGLYDQDRIHNVKKLVNLSNAPLWELILGGDLCAIEHVGFVYHRYSLDSHQLK